MFAAFASRRLHLALLLLPLVGCLNQPADPDGPGDFIGVFSVEATQDANTCGTGALGAPSSWTFETRLSREVGLIYWNNGSELITGTLASDKHAFSFDTSIVINMRDQNSPGWLAPCAVTRHDKSSGKLADDDTTFTGKLSYDFAPTTDSDCSDLVTSDTPTFAVLPCGMSYTLEAKRTSTTP